jgi:hypothetical protein
MKIVIVYYLGNNDKENKSVHFHYRGISPPFPYIFNLLKSSDVKPADGQLYLPLLTQCPRVESG